MKYRKIIPVVTFIIGGGIGMKCGAKIILYAQKQYAESDEFKINSLSGNETSDDYIKWYVPSQTAYVEDLVKACGVDTENLKAKLNDVRKAFED